MSAFNYKVLVGNEDILQGTLGGSWYVTITMDDISGVGIYDNGYIQEVNGSTGIIENTGSNALYISEFPSGWPVTTYFDIKIECEYTVVTEISFNAHIILTLQAPGSK